MNLSEMKQKKWGALLLDAYHVKMVMLVLAFVASVPYFNMYSRPAYQLVLVWGLVVLAVDLFTERKCFKNPYAVVCFLFCVANGITAIIGYKIGFAANISKVVYIGVYMFCFFAYDIKEDKEKNIKELITFFKCIIICTFILNTLCLLTYLLSVKGWYWLGKEEVSWMPIGMYEGRLWGIYNANTGGAFAFLSIILSLFLKHWNKISHKEEVFLRINVIIQILELAMGQSRTATIQLVLAMFLYLFFVRQKISQLWADRKQGIKKSFAYLGFLVGLVVLLRAAVPVMSGVHWVLRDGLGIAFSTNNDEEGLAPREENYENLSGTTSGRLQFWKIGIQLWEKHKVWGIGSTNIYEYGKDFLSEERQMALKGGGLHNVYITTLVASGIVGFGIFVILIIGCGLRLVRCILKAQGKYAPLLSIIIGTMLVGEFMESRILYGKSAFAIIFWVIFGYTMYFVGIEKKDLNLK